MSQPNLRLIDGNTGEVLDVDPEVASLQVRVIELQADLDNAELDLRRARRRIKTLTSDREREQRTYAQRDAVQRLFDYWCKTCRHPAARLDADRFDRLRWGLEHYGEELCRRAIDGAAHDPFVTKRRNGSAKRHDGIALVFRDADHVEDMANRAPR